MADEFYKRLSVKTVWWDIYDLMPDLFIDFDSNRLYSEYVENMHYENMCQKAGLVNQLTFVITHYFRNVKCFG